MKILHTADWHLGMDLHKVSLLEDQKAMLQQLYQVVEQKQIDVVLICGDIYDSALATKDAISLFDEAMTTLCKKMKRTVIVIAGNHDSAERLASMHALLKDMGLYIFGKLTKQIEPVIIQDTAFYPVPYFHLETFKEAYGVQVQSSEEAFQHLSACANQEHLDKHHILLAHTFCTNAQLSKSDRFASIAGSDLVSAQVFEGFEYVALGHLHRMQEIKDHVWYSGSPIAYSFSEANHTKCFLLYDTETKEVTQHEVLPLHPLLTYTGSFAQIQERLLQPIDPQAYQKIELLDQGVTFEMMAYFKEHVPNLLQLVGKQMVMNQGISIEIDEMDEMDDVAIVKQFFLDYYDSELSAEELAWFLEAQQQLEDSYAS